MQADLAARVDRFSIVDGGPFVALQTRLGLLEAKAAVAPRRVVILVGLAFGVPLVLALIAGDAWGPLAERPFLLDWGVWTRFVLAITVFVMMERLVEERLKVHLRQFVDTPLLAPGAMAAAAEAVTRALERRDSPLAEIVCVALAFLVTLGSGLALGGVDTASWLVRQAAAAPQLSLAGWWVLLVSNPLFCCFAGSGGIWSGRSCSTTSPGSISGSSSPIPTGWAGSPSSASTRTPSPHWSSP